jgi:uncharacterized membrane protein
MENYDPAGGRLMDGLLFALTLIAALGCGLVAGVFFAFSTFVMKGLGRLPEAQGMAAMQAINVAAPSFAFMLALFGTALVCVALVAWGLVELGEPFGPYLLAGGVLYLAGVIALTIGYHVPRNNALAAADPHAADGARLWARYHREWTAWNHMRTATALAAAAAFTLALQAG